MKGATFLILVVGALGLLHHPEEPVGQVPAGFVNTTFTCWVDNFGFDGRTFPIRVFTMDQYWVPGGPILFYTGNEGAIELFIEASGNLPILAQELGAVLVFAEHRYFGDSMPFGAQSLATPENAKYLSPHQALADYAYLVSALLMIYGEVPVIAVGGSYGGMLAAWFRIKYPHLIDGALAASAPLFHFPNTVLPEDFNSIVTDDFAIEFSGCPSVIFAGFQVLNNYMYQEEQYYLIENTFQTCQEIVGSADVNAVINFLNGAYVYMAMTDYPYDTNFLNPMPADPVNVACDAIALVPTDPSPQELLEGLYTAANIYYNYTGSLTCNDLSGDYSQGLGIDGWDYLSCSTLVMPIAQNGMPSDMFLPQPWDYLSYASQCQSSYGRAPQPLYPQTYYGTSTGPTYSSLSYISNIIFSSGTLDPWQSGAVLSQPSSSFITIVTITGGAHHLDLRAPNPADPQSVIEARATELNTIQQWVNTALSS